jgi:D-serine deaminase-like pyridoxal phosphate-dependent protein
VFAASGIADILVASEVVTVQKIRRLCAVARHARVTVAVDSVQNARDLSEAAQQAHATLGVAVHVRVRGLGAGVAPGAVAVELARHVSRAKGLSFQGLMAYEGVILAESPDKLATESRAAIQPVLDTRQMVEQAGFEVRMVSVGGTHNYEIAGAMVGVTEVRAGSYALMDHRHAKQRPQFKIAARVLATVTSRPDAESVITDTGQKAIGADLGMPVPDGVQGLEVVSLSAEHGKLKPTSADAARLDVGDKLWLVPYDIGTCVNLYDYMHAVRDGKLEAVWDVSARGLYQ